MEKQETFQYTYSAKEQEELRKIRSKYLPREESKLEQLQRLDAQVTRKAVMCCIIVGVTGSLIMGLGMSLVMSDLGEILGIGNMAIGVGLLIGVAGMILMGGAYPIYCKVLKKEREKKASEILRLTDELMR